MALPEDVSAAQTAGVTTRNMMIDVKTASSVRHITTLFLVGRVCPLLMRVVFGVVFAGRESL
jgi:hypothetical protein